MERMSRRQIVTLILVALVVIAVAAVAAVGLNQSTQTANADPEAHTHDGWTATNTLPTTEGGSYYLTDDVTITSSWNVPAGTTNLCLNGHGIKVTGTDSVIYIASGRTLNIYDYNNTRHYFNVDSYSTATGINDNSGSNSFDGGYITGGKGKDNQMHGGGVYVNGTFNLYGGNIIGNTVTAKDNCGAGVYCNGKSTFRMYGGSISYNYAQNAGCAIFGWENATIEIYGGEISYNKTSHSSGSAISFWGGTASLKLYGGNIHDNLTHGGEGAVNLATASPTVGLKGNLIVCNNATDSTSSTAARNVYVGSKPINIEGALTNTEKIQIRLSSGTGTFTKDWSQHMSGKDPADYFYSENTDYQIYLLNGEAAILAEAPVASVISGDTTTEYISFADALTAWTEGTTLKLLSDVTVANAITVTETRTIDLNGHILNVGYNNDIIVGADDGDNVVLTVDNSRPEAGGVLGMVGVYPTEGCYVLLKNCRLELSVDDLEAYSNLNHVEEGYEIKAIDEQDSAYEQGFRSIVQEIPPHVHNYTLAYNGTNHWYECSNEDGRCDALKIDEAAHSYGAITSTAYYICSVCGYVNNDRKTDYENNLEENKVATVTKDNVTTKYLVFNDALNGWVDGSTLTLYANVTISSTINVSSDTKTLDLNGYGIKMTGNGSVISVGSGATLNLNDSDATTLHYYTVDSPKENGAGQATVCDQETYNAAAENARGTFTGGYITGGSGTYTKSAGLNSYYGGGVYVGNNSTFNMYGGTIIGNNVDDEFNCGAGVYVDSGATFQMDGGAISYNYAQNSGAAIGMYESTVVINGGTISYNKNNWAGGGAISLVGVSTLKLYGGVIENNWTNAGDGAVDLVRYDTKANQYFGIKGSPIVENNETGSNGSQAAKNVRVYNVIHIDGPLSNNAKIGVRLNSLTGVLTSGWSQHMSGKDPNDYFISDIEGLYFIVNNDGEVEITDQAPVATVTNGETVTEYNSLADALTAWTEGTTLTFLTNIPIDDVIVVTETKTLDLNGKEIEMDIRIEGGYITFDGLTEDNKIGIDMDEPGIFTRGWAAKMSGSDPADYFVSKKDGYEINLYAGELRLIDSNSQSGAATVEWVIRMKSKRSVSDVYGEIVKEKLNENEKIVGVYDVKLIRTTTENGVQTEESVQPSAMGEGRTVVVRMSVPKAYRGKQFRIMHIHSETEAEFVEYVLKGDDQYAVVTADKLSEFAFVVTEKNNEEPEQGQGQGGSDPTDSDHQYVPLDPNEPPVINNTNGEGGNPVLHGDTIDVPTDADEVTVEWFYDDDEDEQPDDPNDPIGRGKTYTVVCPDPNDPTHDDSGHTIIAVIKQNKDENGNDYPEDEKPTVVSNLIKVAGHDDPEKDNKVIEDEDKGIEIELVDVDDENTRNISVEVEVKAEVSQEITQVEDNKLTEQLTENDEIAIVYEVKLIQTTKIDGFEYREEIQPSDIKPGTTVIIRMDVPEELRGKEFRVLHIHTENDVEEVAYTVSADGSYITVRAHRLSEFAFVANNAAGDNNGQGGNGGESGNGESGNENSGSGNEGVVSEKKEFCPGWISIIFGFIVLAYFIVIAILVSKRFKALRRLLSMIGLGASWAITLAALIIVAVHTCTVSVLGFGLCVLDILLFIIFAANGGKKCKKCGACKPDDVPAEVAATEEGTEDAPVEAVAVAPVEVESEVIDAEPVAESAPEEPVAEEPVAEETVAEEPAPEEPASEEPAEEEISLRESLSLATTVEAPASETVSKDFIGESLTKKYGDGVKVNRRGNLTRTGLPLADTHYVIRPDGKECFVYVYETNGTVMILAQLADKEAKELRKKHKNVNKSAFPKSKKKWYSIVVDDSFTAEDVEALLETSYNHVK